ncbi:MAG: hypothetical protein NTY00_05625 [Deltaproteobacteria bacterium]|nr:hypothetical protein [Deltaproteobacteria bacterium]
MLENAAASKFSDFDDAVVHEATCHAGATYIATRNIADFTHLELPVFELILFVNTLESLMNNCL